LYLTKQKKKQNEFKMLLVFLFETTQSLIEGLQASRVGSVRDLDIDSREMLMQLFSLIDQSFSWEFTSSKR
jgi:hypothetical protein